MSDKQKELLNEFIMTDAEIKELIAYEDACGVDTFLQELLEFKYSNFRVFGIMDEKGLMVGYRIEEINER